MKEIVPILDPIVRENGSLVIIAEDIKDSALSNLIVNAQNGIANVVAIKAPEFGDRRIEMLEDIAVLTRGTVVSFASNDKLETTEIGFLGKAEKVIVENYSTTIIGGKGDENEILERADYIRDRIDTLENQLEIDFNKKRLAKFIGGVAIIKVGANSVIEIKEKTDRVEDALGATRAAIDEGIVPGGGVALVRAIKSLDNIIPENQDEKIGVDIVRKSIVKPIMIIAENSGKSGEVILAEVMKSKNLNFGYNARKDKYQDLVKNGIIDPKKITRTVIENASSVAGLYITTECAITFNR